MATNEHFSPLGGIVPCGEASLDGESHAGHLPLGPGALLAPTIAAAHRGLFQYQPYTWEMNPEHCWRRKMKCNVAIRFEIFLTASFLPSDF